MGVDKKRLILLFIVVLVVVMVRLPTTDAAVNDYIATAFTDSSGNWGSESNAYDGDWGTYADNVIFADGDDYPSAYASGFDSGAAGSGTITQVDIIVRMSFASSSSSDQWGITLDVGASTGNVLSALSGAVYSLNNNTFTDVTEPNGGGWSWAEIQAAEIHLDSDKVAGRDNDVWNIYEFAFKITTTPAGTDYTAYPSGSLALGGTTALAASFSKTLIEGFALAGVTALAAAFAVTLIQGFTLVGTTALAGIYSKTLIEGFALAGSTSVFVIIQILIVEGFALTGGVSLAAAFVVTLVQGFALGGTAALAVSFVVTLIQGFSLGGTVTALKVLIVNLQESFTVGVGSDILKIVGVSLVGSLFFQLFFSLNMWGYLGPIGFVILGYFVAKKDRVLGVLWFVVESLIIANYLTLVEATPEYWWHTIILLIGCIFTLMYSTIGDK